MRISMMKDLSKNSMKLKRKRGPLLAIAREMSVPLKANKNGLIKREILCLVKLSGAIVK